MGLPEKPKRVPEVSASLRNYRLQRACANCRHKEWRTDEAGRRGWWQCQNVWHAGARVNLWGICDDHEDGKTVRV